MHWRAQCHAKWPMRGRAVQHSSGIEPICRPTLCDSAQWDLPWPPSHWFLSIARKKTSYFATCNWFFCVQDCRTQIFQVEYQGQTRNTRSFERKPLIEKSNCIRHRLELKYFHFAQLLLNAHRAAHQPRKVRTDNLKFRTDLLDRVMDDWSVTQ